jgi:hypothetical protein
MELLTLGCNMKVLKPKSLDDLLRATGRWQRYQGCY